jgi:hypothetical protein
VCFDAEGAGDTRDVVDGHVLLGSLDGRDIGAVEPGLEREALLREAALGAQAAHVAREDVAQFASGRAFHAAEDFGLQSLERPVLRYIPMITPRNPASRPVPPWRPRLDAVTDADGLPDLETIARHLPALWRLGAGVRLDDVESIDMDVLGQWVLDLDCEERRQEALGEAFQRQLLQIHLRPSLDDWLRSEEAASAPQGTADSEDDPDDGVSSPGPVPCGRLILVRLRHPGAVRPGATG